MRRLEAGEYQKALESWGEVQALDPKYPDRKRVQKTARKKLKELSEPKSPRGRLPKWAIVLLGLLGVAAIVAIAYWGIRSWDFEALQEEPDPALVIAASTTKTPTKTLRPSATTTRRPTATIKAVMGVATTKASSTPTRKPTSMPATATAPQMVSDDFEDPAFDGNYNRSIWGYEIRSDPEIGTAHQEDGILVFTSEGKDKPIG